MPHYTTVNQELSGQKYNAGAKNVLPASFQTKTSQFNFANSIGDISKGVRIFSNPSLKPEAQSFQIVNNK